MTARTTADQTIEMTTMTMRWTTRGVVAALVIGALAIARPAMAQERSTLREAPGVENTRQLLIAAYPELREGRVDWRVTTTATGFIVEAHRVETPFVTRPSDAPPLVSGAVVVDEAGALQSLRASGTLLSHVRQKALTVSARRPADLNAALKVEQAKFAPEDSEKAPSLVSSGVHTVLDVAVVRSQTFRSDPPPDKVTEALTWQLDVEGADAGSAAFTLVFEPIQGHLMSVVRR